jgi:hypothetical protein
VCYIKCMNTQAQHPTVTSLTANEVANILRISIQKVERMRQDNSGPPFVRIGKAYRYPVPALVEWIADRATVPTRKEAA